MKVVTGALGVALIGLILWEAFETIVLPRRVSRRVRLTRGFYRASWHSWSAAARLLPAGHLREATLGVYGPLSLLVLLLFWAAGLVLGFALLEWALDSPIHVTEGAPGFGADLYVSATTFFTLGLGDVIPRTPMSRALTAAEGGMGFAFLALVIGYVPVLYQSFSRREVRISLLDARAGSPPSAGELLRRHAQGDGIQALDELLHEWELWSAELLESHLSYPVLAYFRSQHSNQSWLAALTTILDASALVVVGVDGACQRQARLTFAMARHAVGDLAQVFSTPPLRPPADRLSADALARLREKLAAAGLRLREGQDTDRELRELRGLYEPYVVALARHLELDVPDYWRPGSARPDNWQTTAWEHPPARLNWTGDQAPDPPARSGSV